MDKSKIRVLIVEDDPTQGPALLALFTRAGYQAMLCSQSAQALSAAQHTEFQCLFVDCLMPVTNGIDLVQEILKLTPRRPKVFLTSGIFKDKSFIKEAMAKTQAEAFFPKPLHLEEVLAHIEPTLTSGESVNLPNLIKLYGQAPLDNASMTEFFVSEATLHASHLPKLYQRLHETTLTGQLTLISALGDISEVDIFKGRVCAVRTPDPDSLFGAIAVSFGFVMPEEVQAAMNNPSEKRLGQKLIESIHLSPHNVQVILEEQLALRLSQTVQNDVVSMDWESRQMPAPQHTLAASRLSQLIDEWLQSKISGEWMKSIFIEWGAFQIHGHFHSRIRSASSLAELVGHKDFKEATDIPELFRHLMSGQAYLTSSAEPTQDFSFLEARLERLVHNYKTQNHFQFLGVPEKFHPRDLSKAFDGFRSSLDPSRLPANCPPELAEKAANVLKHVTQAYNVLSNEVELLKYQQLLSNRRSQELLEADPIFRAGILDVRNGLYKEAHVKFKSLAKRDLNFRDLRAYTIWAGLKLDRNYDEVRLDQVPPEERHSIPFMMARGISYRAKAQFKKAIESFRAAYALDSNLRIAIHELRSLRAELEKNRGQNREVLRELAALLEGMPQAPRKRLVS